MPFWKKKEKGSQSKSKICPKCGYNVINEEWPINAIGPVKIHCECKECGKKWKREEYAIGPGVGIDMPE